MHIKKIVTPVLAKATSHEFLRRHLIEVNESLPLIETVDELRPQDSRSVAIRSIVLSHVIGLGFGADAKRLQASLSDFGLLEHASPKERKLLGKAEHTQQEKVNATWLVECVQSLAWCLGLVDLDPSSIAMITLPAIFRYRLVIQAILFHRQISGRLMKYISKLTFITDCIGQRGTLDSQVVLVKLPKDLFRNEGRHLIGQSAWSQTGMKFLLTPSRQLSVKLPAK